MQEEEEIQKKEKVEEKMEEKEEVEEKMEEKEEVEEKEEKLKEKEEEEKEDTKEKEEEKKELNMGQNVRPNHQNRFEVFSLERIKDFFIFAFSIYKIAKILLAHWEWSQILTNV